MFRVREALREGDGRPDDRVFYARRNKFIDKPWHNTPLHGEVLRHWLDPGKGEGVIGVPILRRNDNAAGFRDEFLIAAALAVRAGF